MFVLMTTIVNFQGDLTDISAKTATPHGTSCMYFATGAANWQRKSNEWHFKIKSSMHWILDQ